MVFDAKISTVLLLAISVGVNASPLAKIVKLADFDGCTDDQTAQIQKAIDQTHFMGEYAREVIRNGNQDSNKGYTNYFKPEDLDKTTAAFGLFETDTFSFNFNIRCAPASDCPSGSFMFTDSTPEDYEGNGHSTGVRVINVCPAFFDDDRTKRTFPAGFDDKDGITEYCKYKETKKFGDYETGAHTMFHEITHLDEFGKAAGFPEQTTTNPFEYTYHGTTDWKGNSTPGNGRVLKNSSAQNKPERWQNAESLAAAALEMLVQGLCQVDHIDL